jgi:hypothetical protein
MGNRKLATILRCTGLTLLVLGVLVLLPATASAASHLITIGKSCISPKNTCATAADCTDGNECTSDVCSTDPTANPPTNFTDCTIIILNPATHADNIDVTEACDTVSGGVQDCTILTSSSLDGGGTASSDPDCAAGTNLGGGTTCTLLPGQEVDFHSSQLIPSGSPLGALPDQADVTVVDTCSGSPTGCSSTPNNEQIPASTNVVSGCTNSPITCNDNNPCTTDTCDPAIGCVFTPNPPCDDNNPCTDDTCDPVLGCVFTPNTSCVTNEICRTPGFWGTHACPEPGTTPGTECTLAGSVCEKAGSQNITQIVLDNFTGPCGAPLLICGNDITNTCLNDQSAVEAICVAVKGDSSLQVARQLTAAALNCILSNSAPTETAGTCTGAGENCADVCSGVSVSAVFTACNDPANLCATTATVDGTVINCIDALDCFNNGGFFDVATDSCAPCQNPDPITGLCPPSCHDRDLVNGCFSFNPPGPAGSPKECNDARKDNCTVLCSVSCDNTSLPGTCS